MFDLPSLDVILPLFGSPNAADLPQIRALTRQAIDAIHTRNRDGCGDELYALCNLLFLVGGVEDVLLLHEAKWLNMDTGSMIDDELFWMQSDRETLLRYVEAHPPKRNRERLLANIDYACESPKSASEVLDDMRRYFGLD